MRCFIGIDLGSTTTKAVVIDEQQNVLGRGITNSRSNYDTAAAVAQTGGPAHRPLPVCSAGRCGASGALNGSLDVLHRTSSSATSAPSSTSSSSSDLEATCRRNHGADQLRRRSGAVSRGARRGLPAADWSRRPRCSRRAPERAATSSATSPAAVPVGRRGGGQEPGRPLRLPAERVRPLDHRRGEPASMATRSRRHLLAALERTFAALPETRGAGAPQVEAPIKGILDTEMEETYVVGTGYGRARLPFPQGADPLARSCATASARTRCSRARAPCSTSAARTPRPSRWTTTGIVDELPDERPLRRRLRALPRLHRRRDEPGPARAGPAGVQAPSAGRASTRPAPCSPAPSCASGCRWARSARTSWPACTARSSCARCRSWRARAASATSSPSPAAWPRTRRPCKALTDLVARELRRAARSTSTPTRSTPARSAAPCSRGERWSKSASRSTAEARGMTCQRHAPPSASTSARAPSRCTCCCASTARPPRMARPSAASASAGATP